MRTTRFIAAALLLVVAAVGLHPSVAALQQRFAKQTIAMKAPFERFDLYGLPSFAPDLDEKVYETTAEEVGTEHWLSVAFREDDGRGELPPLALFLTYYSDPDDQVPHTPEVCFRQGGAIVTRLTTTSVSIPGLNATAGSDDATSTEVETRLLELDNAGVHQVLLYLFCCNGRFYWDRERVRWAIAMPGDRFVYFSKIEVLTAVPDGADPTQAIDRCKALLAEVLPVLVERHLPSREDVR